MAQKQNRQKAKASAAEVSTLHPLVRAQARNRSVALRENNSLQFSDN